MSRRYRSLVLLLALAVPAWAAGCGGPAATEQPAEAPPAPKPKNAAEIARTIVKGRVGVMVWNERLRGHNVADKIRSLDLLGPMLEGTGIDPIRDVHAAYVASTGVTRDDLAVAIVQHLLTDDQVRQGIDVVVSRSEPQGEWLPDMRVPTARVTVRGQTRALALVEPGFLAILPASLAPLAARFVGPGGFNDPEGPEAIVATAVDPSHSLSGSHAPSIPPSLSVAVAKIRLAEDGGADIAFDAESTDPAQAAADAEALTESIDRATSIKLGFIRVRLFDRVVFRGEGSRVKSDTHLTGSEIDRLASIAGSLMPR